jgi:hypothetical protein
MRSRRRLFGALAHVCFSAEVNAGNYIGMGIDTLRCAARYSSLYYNGTCGYIAQSKQSKRLAEMSQSQARHVNTNM